MPIIDYNVSWMLFNLYLALLALLFGYLALVIRWKIAKIIFGILWLLYLPNTIYIFTDLEHFLSQWYRLGLPLSLYLIFQYALFEIAGITIFIFALVPFEKWIHKNKHYKSSFKVLMVLFNFLIAFGMVLGRVERINSWEFFTATAKVFSAAVSIVTSLDLIGLTILFGFLCNFVYFLLRDPIHAFAKQIFHELD